jgi:hypothetical protein
MEEASHVRYVIMNGKQYLVAMGPDLNTLWRAYIKEADYKAILIGMLNDPTLASALWGKTDGSSGMDIYELIEQSQNVEYGESDYSIDGLGCYQIGGTCKYGQTKIIFSPDRGYVPLKWEIAKKPGDHVNTKLLRSDQKERKYTFNADDIEEVDGYYIPMKGRMLHTIVHEDDHITNEYFDYEWSNIQPFPDFEAISAFEFNLPSSIPVTLESDPGVRYHLNDGQLCPMID